MPTPTASFDWHEGSGASTASLVPGGFTLSVTDWTIHNGSGAIGPSGSVTDWSLALSITVNTLAETAMMIDNGSQFYNLNGAGHVGIFPNYSTSGPVLVAGAAATVVFVVSGGTTLNAYINGTLVGTWSGSYTFDPTHFTVMMDSHPNAVVHTLRYWGGVALTADDVAGLDSNAFTATANDPVGVVDSFGVNAELVRAMDDPVGLSDALTMALEVAQEYLVTYLSDMGLIDAATFSITSPPVMGAIELAPFPANYQVLWETWQSGGVDELNNAVDTWADPVPRMVIGYSSRRLVTQDGIHAAQDMDNLRLAVPADFPWAARDIVTIPTQNALGGRYQVTGAADANMGFHGWRPGLVLEVQRVEG